MIGGNIVALLQVNTTTKNEIGEPVKTWHDVCMMVGWLDMLSGDADKNTYYAKIQESTHLFICDYFPIPEVVSIEGKEVRVDAENTRIVADSKQYDVVLIDNPMGLNRHLEIMLNHTGWQ